MKRHLVVIACAIVLVLCGVTWLVRSKATAPTNKNVPTQMPASGTSTGFNKNLYSIDEPTSIWVVVNKQRPLNQGSTYIPSDLIVPAVPLRLEKSAEQMQTAKRIEAPMQEMFEAAKKEGLQFSLGSGYRSYALQKQFYDGYVKTLGQAEADRTSARPGTSEHQTGLSFDVEATNQKCHLDKCLADLPDGMWLAAHAHEYGFIIRYPEGKEAITGYDYEPWHLRYVGKELAAELHRTGQTMEEFFGLH